MVRFRRHQALRRCVLDALDLDVAPGKGCDHRPVRLRQVDPAADADDAGDDRRRRHRGRWRAVHPHAAGRRAGAGRLRAPSPRSRQGRHGVPAVQSLPPHDRAREHHRGAVHVLGTAAGRRRGARARDLLDMVGLGEKAIPIRASCRAASSSAWRSRGRSPCDRRSCCSTR